MKIEFKTDNYSLLSQGKESTVRLGTKTKYIEHIGKGVVLYDDNNSCKAIITEVLFKQVGSLTLEDSIMDGFTSVEALGKELAKCYDRDLFYYDIVTIIKFVVLK